MILCSKMLFTLWTVKSSGHALYVGHYSNIYTFATTSRPLSSVEMTGFLASAWRNSFVTVCWPSSAVIFMKFRCVDCLVQLGCWRQTVRPWWLCRKSRVGYVRSTKLWIAAAAAVSVQLMFWKKPVINLRHCICVPCRPAFLLLPTLCWSVHFTEHLMTVRLAVWWLQLFVAAVMSVAFFSLAGKTAPKRCAWCIDVCATTISYVDPLLRCNVLPTREFGKNKPRFTILSARINVSLYGIRTNCHAQHHCGKPAVTFFCDCLEAQPYGKCSLFKMWICIHAVLHNIFYTYKYYI